MRLRHIVGAGAIGASCVLGAPAPHLGGDAGAIVPEGVRATADLMSLHQEEKWTTTKVKYEGVEAPPSKLKRVEAPGRCVETKVTSDSIKKGELIYVEGHPSYVTDKWVKDGFVNIKSKSAVEGEDYQIKENEDTEFEVPKKFSDNYYVHIVKAPAGSSIKEDTAELITKDGTKLVVPEHNVASTAWDNMMYPTSDDGETEHKEPPGMPLMSVTYLCGQPNKGIHILEAEHKGDWTDEANSWWGHDGDYGSERLHTDRGTVVGPRMSKPSTCFIM